MVGAAITAFASIEFEKCSHNVIGLTPGGEELQFSYQTKPYSQSTFHFETSRISPNSSLFGKNNARNIKYMPALIFSKRLDLRKKCLFSDRLLAFKGKDFHPD